MSTKLLGEIVTWAAGKAGVLVPHDEVKKSLEANGLDSKVLKAIKPRAAFMRSVKEMATERIIRIVEEDAAKVSFQFTSEKKSEGSDDTTKLDYTFEAIVHLDKETGEVASKDASLKERAEKMVSSKKSLCTALDISNMIQKLFAGHDADIFSVRDQGGVYFVPSMHSEYVDKVQRFYESIGGKVNRFPVPDGSANAKKSVKDTVDTGVSLMVSELTSCISRLDADSRPATIERYAKRIKVLQFKMGCYKDYLAERADELNKELKAAKELLKNKLTEISE